MRYLFGDYVLDTQRYELQGAGRPIKLRRKVFQVLAYLLAHHDRVVPTQELLEHVWPDLFVRDEALKACIKTIRRALGERGRTARFLRTVHGQGYRFVAAVAVQEFRTTDTAPPALIPDEEEVLRQAAGPSPVLAAPLADTGSPSLEALDGEHKQATVLCAALAEGQNLAARLGPETMHHLMQDVLGLAHATVQRYDGVILQVSGVGFLALFGAPVAQEDHARRAVLAALDLRQRLRAPDMIRGQPAGVALGLGLHTGPVVVGPLAHAPQQAYTAAGDTLHLATWLQQQAAPDTILVSATTYALVQDEVESAAWQPHTSDLPSTAGPVYAIHRLLRRRAGVPQRGARPLSHFVGRTRELALLHERLAYARGGQGQVIGIAGEPGLGKSRLLAEFARSLDGQPIIYCEGHCLPYGHATPYLPVCALLRQLCDIPDTAPAEAITATVSQHLEAVGLVPAEGAPLLLELLDVPAELAPLAHLSPSARRARTFALLRHLSLHGRLPRILVVENLHWIDPTSEEWLTSLVEHVAGAACLLLVTYRPGYRPPWIGHSAVTQLALAPLTAADSLVMVQSVPQAMRLSAHVHQTIVARAAGNPFFLEELMWAAVERGIPTLGPAVPDTIQTVLAARIDRLPPAEKRLLQTAAVLGTDVPVPLLHAVTTQPEAALHASLEHLQAAEFLYETRVGPALVYTFKHALTQEVAYQSLLISTRQQLHQCIAQVVEAQFPDLAEAQPELLAQHYTEAGLHTHAVGYWQKAGEKAIQRSAYMEAISHFTKGVEVLEALPGTPERIQRELALYIALGGALQATKGWAAPEVEHAYARARELCQQAGDTPQLAAVLGGLAAFYQNQGDLDTARALGEQRIALAQRHQDTARLIVSHAAQQGILYCLGEYPLAYAHCEQSLALYNPQQHRFQASGAPHPMVNCLSIAANVLQLLGYHERGLTRLHEALTLAGELAHPFTLAYVHFHAAYFHVRGREGQAAQRHAEALVALTSEHGFAQRLAQGMILRGAALAIQGQGAEGIAQMRQGLAAKRATGAMLGEVVDLGWLVEAHRQEGQVDEGLRVVAEALTIADATRNRGEVSQLYQLKGELLLLQAASRQSAPSTLMATQTSPLHIEAEACFRQALDIARHQQAKLHELRAAISLSRLWQQQGKCTKARKFLAPIYGWFTEGFDTLDLQEARTLLDTLA
jgi:predicted ATPase/DNA-binding winged helix-turn-helix (wHTH) protein